MQKQALSVAIIVLNEADRLPDCIASVRFADEIIVVDSGSADNTTQIAHKLGCTVLHNPFLGFARQKQFAVDHCRNNWVLILDADERLAEDGPAALVSAIESPPPGVVAYTLARKNFLHGRWIRHGGWWPDPLVRLVHRHKGRFSHNLVHERWIPEGAAATLTCAIEHHSFRDYAGMIEKLQHYSTLGARQMAAENRGASLLSPFSHGAWTFFQTYFLKLGFLDGFDGFMIALLNAGGSFMKYAKLIERMILKKHRNVTSQAGPNQSQDSK